MKKFLLFSMATAFALSASAQNDYATTFEMPQQSVLQGKTAKADVKVVTVDAKVAAKPNLRLSSSNVYSSKVNPLADGTVTAAYEHPNMFFWGFSEDMYWKANQETGLGYSVYLGPAYTDQTWTNYSTGATSFVWDYTDPNATSAEDPHLTSSATNLTVNYPFGQYNVPVLTASDGSNEDEYSYGYYMQLGASSELTESKNFGATMVDYGASYYDGISYLSFMLDPNTVLSGSFLDMFESAGATDVTLGEYGVLYPQPAAPYALSKMWLIAAPANLPAGTEIVADIYALEASSEGYLFPDEPVAHAVFTAESNMTSATNWAVLNFDVSYVDPVTGLEVEGVPYTVDSAIAIMFPLVQDGYEVYPAVSSAPEDVEAMAYDVFSVNYKLNGENGKWLGNFPWLFGDGVSSSYLLSYCLMTDATFGWLYPADGAPVSENNSVEVPTTGGSVTVPFESLYISASLTVDEDIEYDGTISDWATYELADNESTQQVDLTITVDALPADVEGRSCTCTLTPIGAAPVVLTVTQGTTGITAVTTSAAKVSVEGGNFVVTAPEAINAATVYNIAGQAVAASEIAGTTTIDGSSLAKGVYIVRFNDGSSVKVVK